MPRPGPSYRERIADAIIARRASITEAWLLRLVDVVHEDRRDIFPTESYLDHIPTLIEEIARVVRDGDGSGALASPVIARKAIELGEIRHGQKASVNQLLREYDCLSDILEDVVRETTLGLDAHVPPEDCMDTLAAVARTVRSVMRVTVDTFVERYTATIGEQTERLRSLNGFVSHELRTPLQSASLTMEMILATHETSAAERRDLLGLQGTLERISVLLGNLETLAQSEEGTDDDPSRQAVDLSAVARDVAERQRESFDGRGVACQIDDDLGVAVIDAAKFELVLSNLLGNAAKYSDPHKASRRVHVRGASADTDDMLAIAVRDNGLGIEPARQHEVFELHARAHSSLDAAHHVSGRGIGLYLVAETVREMGGTIRLASQPGHWSEFTLCLPRRAAPPG